MKKPARRGRDSSAQPVRASGRWVLPVILLLAFVVKLAVLAQLHAHPLLQPRPGLDSGVYLDLARQVAGGDLLGGTRVFFVSPFYIYVVALVLFLSGGSVIAVQVVQVALGVLAIWLIARTSGVWFGRRGEWLAAGLAAVTGYFCFNDILILQSAVDPVLTALGLWLLVRAWTTGRWTAFMAAGAALGVHVLNRPNVLAWAVVAVALTLGAPFFGRRGGGEAGGAKAGGAKAVLALVGGLLIVLAPVAIRNYVVAHELAIVSSHGGLNFYIGNNARADGAYRLVAGITPSIAGQTRDMRRVAEQATGRPLTDTEASSWFYGQAFAWISGNPGAALTLFAKKVAYVFNATDLPLNDSYAYYATDESWLLRVLAVGPWLLLPLGLAGLWLGRPRADAPLAVRAAWWPFVSFVPVYALAVAVFFVAGRYRLPLLVPLCVTSAGAALALWDRYRARDWRPFGTWLSAVLVLGAATHATLGLDNGLLAWRAEMVLYDIGAHRDADAETLLARTEPDYPNRPLLLYRVGTAYLARGDGSQALTAFERALTLAPDRPEIRLGIGRALLITGRAAEAIPHLRTALQSADQADAASVDLARALAASGDPSQALAVMRALPAPERLDSAAQQAMGRLALDVGDAGLSESFLARAVRMEPGNADAREALGLALAIQGRRSEATAEMETACRMDEGSATARLNLAILYAESGRMTEARARAEEAVRIKPDYTRARQFLSALPPRF